MDWIAPLLNVVVIALLVWMDYRLSRRIAVLEIADVLVDDALLNVIDRLAQLEAATKVVKPRAVKKPAAS